MKPLVYKKSRRVRTQERVRRVKTHIAKGDRVRVITGDHKGQEGTVLRVIPRTTPKVIRKATDARKSRSRRSFRK